MISLLGLDSAGKMLRSEALANLSSELKRESSILEAALKTLKEDARFLTRIPPVQGIIRAMDAEGFDEQENTMIDVWERRMSDILKTVIYQRPAYTQIRFIGIAEGGKEIVRVQQKQQTISVIGLEYLQARGDRDYFKEIVAMKQGETYISGVNYNREHGEITRPLLPILRVGVAVRNKSGEIFGMVVINVDIRLFARSLYQIFTDQFFFLANEDGEFLIHPDENKRLTFEFGRTAKVQDEYRFEKKNYTEPGKDSYTVLSLPDQGVGIALYKIHFDDRNPNRYLLLGLVADFIRINKKSIALGKDLGLLTLGVFLLVGVLSGLSVRWLTRPILQLKMASDKITAGEEGVEIPIASKDEVGDLARSVASMVEKQKVTQDALRKLAGSLEEKVKERTMQLESLNSEMESFVYIVSHDIKSPIVSLQGLTDLISRELGDSLPGDVQTYLEHMKNSVTMMGQLTEDLLELSRVGRMDYRLENVEVNELIDQIIVEQNAVAQEKDVNIFAQPGLPSVIANKKRLYQVFSNLIGNAVKFMPDNTDAPLVEISAVVVEGGLIVFTVKDNGAGIDPRNHDRIFMMFQRGHGREVPGTGMGLALVKRIVENFGGSISLESSTGAGACFRITLPAARKQPNEQQTTYLTEET